MLLLPNGHGLVSISRLAQGDDNGLYDVMFDSGAQASWAPTINFLPSTATVNQTVTLIGTQLCGLSECQHFGDDNQQAEHYPMVRFIDQGGVVTYARAHDASTRSIAPAQPGSVLVDIPSSLAVGVYSVEAVAMGIPSVRVTITIVDNLPLSVSSADPGIVSTLGETWIGVSGTGFYLTNVINQVGLSYDGGAELTLPPLFQWYVTADTDMWILAPPANQIAGLPVPSEPPPDQVTATFVIHYTHSATGQTGTATFPLTYEYLPGVASVDVSPPILWTGQTSVGTVTLNEPAAGSGAPISLYVSDAFGSTSFGVTLPDGLNMSVPVPQTTKTFPIVTSATAKAAMVTISASGPDVIIHGSAPDVTIPLSADQFYLNLQGQGPQGEIESGQSLTAAIYVRNPAGGQITITTTRKNLAFFMPTVASPDAQGVAELPPFTPIILSGGIGDFTITLTRGGNSMTFGPFVVLGHIKLPRPGV